MENLSNSGSLTEVEEKCPELTGYSHVLAAIDFSPMADAVLTTAHGIAKQNNAKLTVCHVMVSIPRVSLLFPQDVAQPDTSQSAAEAVFEQIEERVQELTEREPEEYEIVVTSGDPVTEILALASEQEVDLIVTANRSTSKIAGIVMGTVAQGVVRDASCHVLLVCPPKE
jgi:universal stress protein A